MNELSVNISGSERQQIQQKASALILKTAKARNPDEHFLANLSKRIVEENLNEFAQHSQSSLFEQMHYVYKWSYAREIQTLMFPHDEYIFTLSKSDRPNSLLDKNFSLYIPDIDNLVIPEVCKQDDRILFPFMEYNKSKLLLSEEVKTLITKHNETMLDVYGELEKQLTTILQAIERCKTTKAFNATIPNLTTLYPKSLVLKVNRKNDIGEVELTEEQQIMNDATNSIATANLLGD